MQRHALIAATTLSLLLTVLADRAAPAQPSDDDAVAPVQLWNSDVRDTLTVGDCYGVNYRKLAPIQIVAARNGVFSGRIVVTNSLGSLKNVSASMGELVSKNGGGRMPASAVQVRYALRGDKARDWAAPDRFDALVDAPPAELRVVEFKPKSGDQVMTGPVATLPIHVTVRVPADQAPGRYSGTLTVTADQLPAREVAVNVTVHPWRIADPADFTTVQLGFHSPETLARVYNVPMWSPKHLELLGRELKLMAELNSRRVEVNLAAHTYGHLTDEPYVKFIKQADGSYRYDFSNFDKYMDTVAAAIGKPNPLRLNWWEIRSVPQGMRQIAVTDAATGKTELLAQPEYGSQESYKLWKPLLDELRARIEKRGWFDVTAVGDTQYAGLPTAAMVDMLHKIWPDGQWYSTQHGLSGNCKGSGQTVMPISYAECVWVEGKVSPRGYRQLKPVARPVFTSFARNRHYEHYPLFVYRSLPEEMIMRGRRGVGPLGVDAWPIKDPKGRPTRAGGGALGSGASTKAMLAAGADGPVATERFEAMREGIQLCEAILLIQNALNDKRISGELAVQADRLLQQRSDHFVACYGKATDYATRLDYVAPLAEGSGQRDEALIKMAGQVQAAMAASGRN